MSLALHAIGSDKNQSRKKKRLGRGNSSGKGNYSARGMKGQRSRSGGKSGLKMKGIRARLMSFPKNKGVKSVKDPMAVFNVSWLEKNFDAGKVVTIQDLKKKDIISNKIMAVKILGDGNISKAITLKGNFTVSKTANDKISQAGGTVVVKPAAPKKSA